MSIDIDDLLDGWEKAYDILADRNDETEAQLEAVLQVMTLCRANGDATVSLDVLGAAIEQAIASLPTPRIVPVERSVMTAPTDEEMEQWRALARAKREGT